MHKFGGRVSGKRDAAHRLDVGGHDLVDAAIDAVHVGKQPENGAPPDTGAFGNRLGRRGKITVLQQRNHRLQDAAAAVLRAPPAAVRLGPQICYWRGLGHKRILTQSGVDVTIDP